MDHVHSPKVEKQCLEVSRAKTVRCTENLEIFTFPTQHILTMTGNVLCMSAKLNRRMAWKGTGNCVSCGRLGDFNFIFGY